jgi:hypothetical protein
MSTLHWPDVFKEDLGMPVMKPMLDFLAKTSPTQACSTPGPGDHVARRRRRYVEQCTRQGGARGDTSARRQSNDGA